MDKLLHILISVLIFGVTFLMFHSIIASYTVVFTAAYIKEKMDEKRDKGHNYGGFDILDIIATLCGAIITHFVIIISKIS